MADDRSQIIDTVVGYATAADTRDWSLLDDVFIPDCVGDFGPFQLRDRDGIRAMMSSMLDGCGPTQHLLGNYRIAIDGDRATCTSAIRAFHAAKDPGTPQTYELFGEYRDDLIRTPAGWRIAKRSMRVFHELGTQDILGPG